MKEKRNNKDGIGCVEIILILLLLIIFVMVFKKEITEVIHMFFAGMVKLAGQRKR